MAEVLGFILQKERFEFVKLPHTLAMSECVISFRFYRYANNELRNFRAFILSSDASLFCPCYSIYITKYFECAVKNNQFI